MQLPRISRRLLDLVIAAKTPFQPLSIDDAGHPFSWGTLHVSWGLSRASSEPVDDPRSLSQKDQRGPTEPPVTVSTLPPIEAGFSLISADGNSGSPAPVNRRPCAFR